MTDQFAPDPESRFSSIAGLQEAGIVDSFGFNPFTGLAVIRYTSDWIRIMKSGTGHLVDPIFGAAILTDDPITMRMFVEREAARLAAEDASRGTPPKERTGGRKARR